MSSRYAQRDSIRRREEANRLLMGFNNGPIPEQAKSKPGRSKQALKEPPAVERLRGKVSAKGHHGMHSLTRLMRIMDDNGDGVLTKEELKYGLEDLGVRLNRVEVDELFQYFDRDRNGVISQEEFLRGLRGPLPHHREKLVRDAFDRLEKTFDNSVTLEDLEMAYDAQGHPHVLDGKISAAQALREFLRQWDFVQDEKEVTWKEFLEYHKNLSAGIESDAEFAMLMEGVWHVEQPRKATLDDRLDPENIRRGNEQPAPLVGRSVSKNNQDEENEELTYMSTSALAQRHPDMPYASKTKVPNWIKYGGVTLSFQLFHKETVQEHHGSFDKSTRTFSTKEDESFVVRTFTLKYSLENDRVTVFETTPGRPSQFMAAANVPGLQLQDLAIGKTVKMKELEMQVVDMDKKARDFFRQQYPSISLPLEGLPIPEEPLPKTSHKTLFGVSTARSAPNASPGIVRGKQLTEKRTTASLKFIENDGKILHFDCIWDDPAMYGERHYFSMLFHLCDDTIELREIQTRNSGKERQALINLKRQKLLNPQSAEKRAYTPWDFRIGATFTAFGRVLNIVSCDKYTQEFYTRHGVPGFDSIEPFSEQKQTPAFSSQTDDCPVQSSRRRSGIYQQQEEDVFGRKNEQSVTSLSLYTNPQDQKLLQIVEAIRKTTEQKTRFGSRVEQRRFLVAYLRKFCIDLDDDSSSLSKVAFQKALSGFSCFGTDAELVFKSVARDNKVPIDSILDLVYPEAPVGSSRAMPAAAPVAPPVFVSSLTSSSSNRGLPVRVQSIVQAVRAKLEVMTGFGDERKQFLRLQSILQQASVDRETLSREQFRGAMAHLNCWENDAVAIFDAVGSGVDLLRIDTLLRAIL